MNQAWVIHPRAPLSVTFGRIECVSLAVFDSRIVHLNRLFEMIRSRVNMNFPT